MKNIKTAALGAAIALAAVAHPAYANVFEDLGDAAVNVAESTVDTLGGVVRDPRGTLQGTWDQIRNDPLSTVVNPMQHLNVTGVPQPGDLVEVGLLHPEQISDYLRDPMRFIGSPLAAAIFSARGRARNGATFGVPQHIRQQLAPYFPAWVFDEVRGSVNWGVMNGMLQSLALGVADARAITLIDTVVFRNQNEVNDAALWAHELEHVLQYKGWGVPEFAMRYTTDHHSVEEPAYAKQYHVEAMLAAGNGWQSSRMSVAAMTRPNLGLICGVPNGGTCPMPMASPVGTNCYCTDMYGRQWFGTVF